MQVFSDLMAKYQIKLNAHVVTLAKQWLQSRPWI